MDKIEIKVTRNCDPNGNDGTVVDHAVAVLGDVAGVQMSLVDAIAAAFQDAYGLHEVATGKTVERDGQQVPEMVPVSPFRNMTYRVRQYMTEITTAYLKKVAITQVSNQVDQQVGQTLGTVTILDGKS